MTFRTGIHEPDTRLTQFKWRSVAEVSFEIITQNGLASIQTLSRESIVSCGRLTLFKKDVQRALEDGEYENDSRSLLRDGRRALNFSMAFADN
jgi:hypothetical protein